MNKTDEILGMLTKAMELQNSTTAMIGVARADIAKAEDLIKEVSISELFNQTLRFVL